MKNLIRQTFAKLVLRLASALLRRIVQKQAARATQHASSTRTDNSRIIDGEFRRISDH